jgi:hypothetical protein
VHLPNAAVAAAALVDKHCTIRAGLGYTKRADRLLTPCPRCNTVGRVSYGGKRAYIECQACTYRVRPEYYEHLTKVAAENPTVTARANDWTLLDRYDSLAQKLPVDRVDG